MHPIKSCGLQRDDATPRETEKLVIYQVAEFARKRKARGCRTSLEEKNAVHLAWNTARLMLIGVPAPDLRKG